MKTHTQQQLYEYLSRQGPAGPSAIANSLNISLQMTHRHLKALVEQGKITKTGRSPKVVYHVAALSTLAEISSPSYQYVSEKRLTERLAIIESQHKQIRAISDPSVQAIIRKKLKIEWTYESNAIEGSTLSLGDTIFFIEQGLTVEGKPFKDFVDAKNHMQAIEFLFEVLKDKRLISEGLLKEINALLLFGLKSTPAISQDGQKVAKPAAPGRYKRMANHVLKADGSIHKYVEPEQVASEMQNLCNWITRSTDSQIPVVVVAAIAHYNFVRIHPFDDGNGRGARILMNLILMKHRFIPAVIRSEQRREYFEALSMADDGDLTPFITFVVEQIINTQKQVLDSASKL